MASLQRTIEIIFAGTDNVTSTISDINTGVAGFANNIESATQPLSDLSNNILKVEAALGVMGAAVLFYTNSQAAQLSELSVFRGNCKNVYRGKNGSASGIDKLSGCPSFTYAERG